MGDGEAKFVRQSTRDGSDSTGHARRQWHFRRVSRHSPRHEPRSGEHLRRHSRRPRADSWESNYGHPFLRPKKFAALSESTKKNSKNKSAISKRLPRKRG